MPNGWHPCQGFWDPLNFFHEPQIPQDMKVIPGPWEPLGVFELRWQTWSCTCRKVKLKMCGLNCWAEPSSNLAHQAQSPSETLQGSRDAEKRV